VTNHGCRMIYIYSVRVYDAEDASYAFWCIPDTVISVANASRNYASAWHKWHSTERLLQCLLSKPYTIWIIKYKR